MAEYTGPNDAYPIGPEQPEAEVAYIPPDVPPAADQAAELELGELLAEIEAGIDLTDLAITQAADSIDTEIATADSDIASVTDDMIGGIENAIADAELQPDKIINRIISLVGGEITTGEDLIRQSGIDYPYSDDVIQEMSTTDPADWLGGFFPPIDSTGTSPPPPTSPPYSPPPPPTSPQPHPIFPDSTLEPLGSGGADWTSPPTAPPPPPSGDESCQTTCPAPIINTSCPAPPAVNVNVTVPPTPPATTTVTCGDTTVTTTTGGTATSPITSGEGDIESGATVEEDTGSGGGPFDSPPPPAPPPAAPPYRYTPPLSGDADCMDWDVGDLCRYVDRTQRELDETGDDGGTPSGRGFDNTATTWLSDFLTAGKTGLELAIPGFAAVSIAKEMPAAFSTVLSFATQHTVATKLWDKIKPDLTLGCVSNPGKIARLAAQIAGVQMTSSTLHVPAEYLAQSLIYQFQSLAPQYLPTQADADNLWLKGYIDSETWKCMTKAQGNLPGWHASARDAKQATLSVGEIQQLMLRGMLPGRRFDDRLRELGFINPGYADDLRTLSQLPPGASDVIRFMGRDTFDPAAVEKYGLDKDFKDKFQGDAVSWFQWQGYSTEIARHYYRAHWRYASDPQLFEALHRLRPDRKERRDWEFYRPRDEQDNPLDPNDKGPPVITIDDVRKAMEANDIAPYFVDMLIACSYHPITYTDATRMYMIGYIDKKELVERFLDNGYTVADSEMLTGFWESETARRIRTQSRVLQPAAAVRYYKIGAMTESELRDALKATFPNQTHVDEIIDLTNKEVAAESKQMAVKSLRSAYMHGEYDQQELAPMLELYGIDQQAIPRLLLQWSTERNLQHKAISAAMLCKWADRGLIGPQDHRMRLERLGYSAGDARRIAQVCEIDSQYKKKRRQRQEAKEALADAKAEGMQTLSKLMKDIKSLDAFKKWVEEQTGSKSPDQSSGENNDG